MPIRTRQRCAYCGKPRHALARRPGNHEGNSSVLERRIRDGRAKDAHPWHTGARSLQAHHLICSEALDDDPWVEICARFGYDINRRPNGVMLPSRMPAACQIHVALHRGPHEAGDGGGLAYPARIQQLVASYKSKALSGRYCDTPDQLTADLDSLSAQICAKIDRFAFTLTSDGRDYAAGGQGCGGATRIGDKTGVPCPSARSHSLPGGAGMIPVKTAALVPGE